MSVRTVEGPLVAPVAHQILDQLRHALPKVLAGHGVIAAYAFGSVVRDRMTRFSDVDVALVLAHQKPSYERLMLELTVQGAIEEAIGFSPIDVRAINEAPLQVRGRIVQEGVLIYEGDSRARVAFEVRVRKLYFDFAPVAHALREAFLRRIQEKGVLHG